MTRRFVTSTPQSIGLLSAWQNQG